MISGEAPDPVFTATSNRCLGPVAFALRKFAVLAERYRKSEKSFALEMQIGLGTTALSLNGRKF